jgi:hypothetical protein
MFGRKATTARRAKKRQHLMRASLHLLAIASPFVLLLRSAGIPAFSLWKIAHAESPPASISFSTPRTFMPSAQL